jgi:hypothetical protein
MGWLNVALVSVAVAALTLVCGELALRNAEEGGGALGNPELALPGKHSIIARQSWGPAYLESLRGFHWRNQYSPYVAFRSAPHRSGESINIDAAGRRLTMFNSLDESALLLYAYGGSTTIGIGVPDWGTIPSYMARIINKGGAPNKVRVENRAQVWWTSTQSLMDLIVALHSGERPDVVIFYDGINDFSVVSYGGRAGGIAPYYEILLAEGLERAILNIEPSTLETLRLPNWIRGLLRLPDPVLSEGISPRVGRRVRPKDEAARLMTEAASVYATNVRIVRSLGEQFGFESYFFLQPFPLLSPKPLTKLEAPIVRKLRKPWEFQMAKHFYEEVRQEAYLRSLAQFIDLSRALDGANETIFLDIEHLLPRGNEIAAVALLDGLKRIEAPFLTTARPPTSAQAVTRPR